MKKKKQSENNTYNSINVTKDFEESEKNISTNHKEDHTPEVEPLPTKVSFQCDQWEFLGISKKGIKQYTIIKHKVTQVDGNSTEPDDEDSMHDRFKSEPIIRHLKIWRL